MTAPELVSSHGAPELRGLHEAASSAPAPVSAPPPSSGSVSQSQSSVHYRCLVRILLGAPLAVKAAPGEQSTVLKLWFPWAPAQNPDGPGTGAGCTGAPNSHKHLLLLWDRRPLLLLHGLRTLASQLWGRCFPHSYTIVSFALGTLSLGPPTGGSMMQEKISGLGKGLLLSELQFPHLSNKAGCPRWARGKGGTWSGRQGFSPSCNARWLRVPEGFLHKGHGIGHLKKP